MQKLRDGAPGKRPVLSQVRDGCHLKTYDLLSEAEKKLYDAMGRLPVLHWYDNRYYLNVPIRMVYINQKCLTPQMVEKLLRDGCLPQS